MVQFGACVSQYNDSNGTGFGFRQGGGGTYFILFWKSTPNNGPAQPPTEWVQMKLTTLLHLAQRLTITGAKLLLILYFFLLWRCDPTWVMASSFLRFVDHTQRRTTVGRTPVDEWSARRREIYLTTHNNHNRQISMPPVGFEPTISAD